MKNHQQILFIFFASGLLFGFSYVIEKEASFLGTEQIAQVGGASHGTPLSRALGILPASPDNVVFQEHFPSIISTSRNAGARILYWYWSPAQINTSDPVIPQAMPLLGHPVAITISVWQPGMIGQLPSACTDWKQSPCQTLLVNDIALFAKTYLQSSDYIFLGNEINSYFKTRQADIPFFHTLVDKVVEAVHTEAPNVRVGVSFAYNTPDEEVITAMYNGITNKPDVIGLNAYASPDFTWGEPQEGVTELARAQTLAQTLGTPYAVLETGWGTAASLGSSEEEQTMWASLVKTWIASSAAEFVAFFIALDGDTQGTPCFNAARSLAGGATPPQYFIDYLCTLGFRDVNNISKPAWNTLWATSTPPSPTVSSFTVNTSTEGISGASRSFSLTIHTPGNGASLVARTVAGTNSILITGLSLNPGTYDLYLAAPGFLRKKLTTTLSQNGTYAISRLLAGDFNADNTINSFDWGVMREYWGTSNMGVDINRDGVVNSIDFAYLNKNWMLVGE